MGTIFGDDIWGPFPTKHETVLSASAGDAQGLRLAKRVL